MTNNWLYLRSDDYFQLLKTFKFVNSTHKLKNIFAKSLNIISLGQYFKFSFIPVSRVFKYFLQPGGEASTDIGTGVMLSEASQLLLYWRRVSQRLGDISKNARERSQFCHSRL